MSPAEPETSPISSRIAWLAAQRGALFAHHEVKSSLPLRASRSRATTSSQTGWVGGALSNLDTSLLDKTIAFKHFIRITENNGVHMSSLIPSLAFSGIQTLRFELYLSARLNELLPIIHWYGWDRRNNQPARSTQ